MTNKIVAYNSQEVLHYFSVKIGLEINLKPKVTYQHIFVQGFSLTSVIGHSLLKFPDVRNFSDLVGHIVRLPFLACNIWISTVVYSLFSMPIFIL